MGASFVQDYRGDMLDLDDNTVYALVRFFVCLVPNPSREGPAAWHETRDTGMLSCRRRLFSFSCFSLSVVV